MNGVKLLFLSHYRRHLLLLGVASGFILGCSEPAPPVPKTILAPLRPLSTLSNTVTPPPPVAEPKQQTQTLEMRKLDPEKVKRGEVIYEANCATCHGPKGESTPGWKKQGADGRYPPPPLNGSAHTWHHSTETLEKMIREGSPSGMGGMPAAATGGAVAGAEFPSFWLFSVVVGVLIGGLPGLLLAVVPAFLLYDRDPRAAVPRVWIPTFCAALLASRTFVLWWAIVAAVVTCLVSSLLVRWRIGRSPTWWPASCCRHCGYDMRATSTGICPECGAHREQSPHLRPKWINLWPWLVCPVLIGLISWRYMLPPGWRVRSLIESQAVIGKSVRQFNWTFGTTLDPEMSDGQHSIEMPHMDFLGWVWVVIEIEDGRVVEARLEED